MVEAENNQEKSAIYKRDIKRKATVLRTFDVLLALFFAVYTAIGIWIIRPSNLVGILVIIIVPGSIGFLFFTIKIIVEALCKKYGRKSFTVSYKVLQPSNTYDDTCNGLNYGVKYDFYNKKNKLCSKKECKLFVNPFVFNQVNIEKIPIKVLGCFAVIDYDEIVDILEKNNKLETLTNNSKS